jgi:hypothetical protein
MQVQCRNKRLTISTLHRVIVTQKEPRGTAAAPLTFNTRLHPFHVTSFVSGYLLETPFKRGSLTMRQGLGRNDTIQEAGPPRLLFRGVVYLGTVSSLRAWRPYTSETGPGEDTWLPVASIPTQLFPTRSALSSVKSRGIP